MHKLPPREAARIEWAAAATETLLAAVNRGQPIRLTGSKPASGGAHLDDWAIGGPGLLFAAGSFLASAANIARQILADGKNRDFAAAPLVRSTYEYATTFCWLAADPHSRVSLWVAEDVRVRIAIDGELRLLGGPRLPEHVADDFRDKAQAARGFPSLKQRAMEADQHWAPLISDFQSSHGGSGTLSDLYPPLYRACSQIAHPTAMALESYFVHGETDGFVVGMRSNTSEGQIHVSGPLAFALALLVGARLYPWIDASAIEAAFRAHPSMTTS